MRGTQENTNRKEEKNVEVKDMDIQFGQFTYHPEKGELVNDKTGEVSQYK